MALLCAAGDGAYPVKPVTCSVDPPREYAPDQSRSRHRYFLESSRVSQPPVGICCKLAALAIKVKLRLHYRRLVNVCFPPILVEQTGGRRP